MSELILISHAERLLPEYNPLGAYFSVNIAPALRLAPGATLDRAEVVALRDWLRPWSWRIDGVKAFAVWDDLNSGVVRAPVLLAPAYVRLVPHPPIPGATDAAYPRYQRLTAALDGLFDETADAFQDLTETFGMPDDQIAGAATRRSVDVRPWHARLMHYSTFAAPAPHWANLAWFIRVEKAACVLPDAMAKPGSLRIHFAFLFKVNGVACSPAALPTTDPYEWKYDLTPPDPNLTMRIVQQKCPYEDLPGATSDFIDLSTGWVKALPFGEHWTEGISRKVADAFDLPLILLEALQRVPDLTPAQRAAISAVGRASERDLAGLGFVPDATGHSVLKTPDERVPAFDDWLPRTVWQTAPQAQRDALHAALAAYDLTFTDPTVWSKLLDSIVKPPGAPDHTRHAALSNPATLRDVIAAQWAEAVTKSANADALALWNALNAPPPNPENQQQIRPVFERQSVRSLLARQLLGGCWNSEFSQFKADPEKDIPDALIVPNSYGADLIASVKQYNDLKPLDAVMKQQKMLANLLYRSLWKYFTVRCDLAAVPAGSPYLELRPRLVPADVAILGDGALQTALQTFFQAYAIHFTWVNLTSTARADADLDASCTEDAITLQVDRLESSDNGDATDFLRRIAGFGILIRPKRTPQEAQKEWRCVNLADLRFADPANQWKFDPAPYAYTDAVALNCPIPARVQYSEKIRRPFLSVRNHPLIAISPYAYLAQESSLSGRHEMKYVGDQGQEWEEGVYRYGPPYGAPNGPKMHALRFGRPMEIAVFTIGHGSNLPPDLTRNAPNEFARLTGLRLENRSILQAHEARLLRRQAVSAPRLGKLANRQQRPAPGGAPEDQRVRAFSSLEFPKNVDRVLPLARSLQVILGDKAAGAESNGHFLLLTPPGDDDLWRREAAPKAFDFEVVPPSVPLSVWDCWTERAPDRALVIREFNEWSGANGEPDAQVKDTPIDDPAVTAICYRLTPVFPPDAVTSHSYVIAGVIASDTERGLHRLQSKPHQVRISASAGGTATVKVVPQGVGVVSVDVTVPKGQVWRLDICAAVPAVDANRRKFRNSLWPGDVESPLLENYKLFSPLAVFVEVATDAMPSAETVHQALHLPVAPDHGHFDVVLKTTQPSELRWIHRVERLTQQRRWQGRPLPFKMQEFVDAMEDPDPVKAAARAAPFDGAFFGDRPSSDHRRDEAFVDFAFPAPPGGAGLTALNQPQEQLLGRQETSQNPGAQYYRVGLLAYSRYEGILNRGPLDSRVAPPSNGENWQRALIKCRPGADMTVPHVKLVLPLTEPLESDDAAGDLRPPPPCLLAILEEPWGGYGGLAEQLGVTAAFAPDPEKAAGEPRRAQIGPDPIVRTTPILAVGENPAFEAIGPIGYTLDDDATLAPKFIHTSFIVRPAAVENDSCAPEPREWSWDMVRLKFRREFLPGLMLHPAKKPHSDWSAGVPAQFLPPFSWVRVTPVKQGGAQRLHVRSLRLRQENGSSVFVVRRDAAASPEALRILSDDVGETQQARSRFKPLIMLTRRITDIFGHPGEEAFVGLYDFDAVTGKLVICYPHLGIPPRLDQHPLLRARLFEIQVSAHPAERWLENLPDALYGGQTAVNEGSLEDLSGRPARVSQPFDE